VIAAQRHDRAADVVADVAEPAHASGPATTCPTLRVSIDDAVGSVLLRWELGLGRRNALSEVPT